MLQVVKNKKPKRFFILHVNISLSILSGLSNMDEQIFQKSLIHEKNREQMLKKMKTHDTGYFG